MPPNRARSPDFSDPNHQKKKKKEQSSQKHINVLLRVWTAVLTLHSGRVENVSCAPDIYNDIVSHQSHIFYRAHNSARKIYVLSPILLYF